MKALDRVFSEMSQFTKTMGGMHGDFLSLLHRDIDRFLEETKNVYNQMQWQGYFTLGLTSLGASLAIAGALIPKTGTPAAPSTLDPRLGANDGITDGLSNMMRSVAEKLNDNKFLRTTCKTSAKFFNGVTGPADIYFRSRTTETEAKRSLLKEVNVHNGQSGISAMDQNVALAQRAVQSMLDSKTKGG